MGILVRPDKSLWWNVTYTFQNITFDRYTLGGAGAGALLGLALGPIGAVAGAVVGSVVGDKYRGTKEPEAGTQEVALPPVTTYGQVASPATMTVNAKKGQELHLSELSGMGTVTKIDTTLPNHTIESGYSAGGYITASQSGTALVTWFDQFGNTQTTSLTIVVA